MAQKRKTEDRLGRPPQTGTLPLRAFREESPECMMVVAGSGRFRRMNASAREFLGYTKEELFHLNLDLIGAGSVRDRFGELGKSGRSRIEGSFVKKNGTPVRAVMHAAGVGDGSYQLILAEIAAAREAREAADKALALDLGSTPLLLADLSALRLRLEGLRAGGMRDLEARLRGAPGELAALAALVRPLAMSRSLGELLGRVVAGDRPARIQDLLAGAGGGFAATLSGLWRGGASCESVYALELAEGRRFFRVQLSLEPARADPWSRALLSFVDVTGERRSLDELEAAVAEKTLLLEELEHRVKNSLNLVASMLGIEARSLHEGECAAPIMAAQARIRTVASLYERLSEGRDAKHLECAPYLEGIIRKLRETYCPAGGRVRIGTRLAPLRIDAKRAASIGLILNELITNSLKHAFPGEAAGEILVETRLEGDRLGLRVADDGVGLPGCREPAAGRGQGLQFVEMLTRQLCAELEVSSTAGCAYSFSIPLRP
ncbi:MAG TPA: histidine kinase dimerization/phosphoacceptor domain -containing protein [Rectinemataceae bacterium]|nr:histidine kinase dimerization/phosphoacceptor domain -containing protein [Rectinemataceae bacterium]